MANYVQCELRNGKRVDVRWIEEKHAVKDKNVKIKLESGSWEEGWVVSKTYGKMDEAAMLVARDVHKHHRKGTDI